MSNFGGLKPIRPNNSAVDEGRSECKTEHPTALGGEFLLKALRMNGEWALTSKGPESWWITLNYRILRIHQPIWKLEDENHQPIEVNPVEWLKP